MKRFINISDVNESAIKITFCFNGYNLDFDDITEKMDIMPSITRRANDFPEGAIKAGYAKDIWELTLGFNESNSLSKEFENIVDILWSKIPIINKLKYDYNLNSSLSVVVQAYISPYLLISNKCIEFAYKINTEIDLDVYYFEPPESKEFTINL